VNNIVAFNWSLSALANAMPGTADRRGGMAITMTFAMMAALGIAALAVDGASAMAAHARLDLAADAGALTALRSAAAAYALDSKTDLTLAEIAGQQRFMAQAGGIAGVSVPAATVHVQRDGLQFTADVTYVATYVTQLAGALHGISAGYASIPSLPLGGTATAQERTGAFVDIQVLMDVSNSMAIGATHDARNQLQGLTSAYPLYEWGNNWWPNCAIACHMKQPLESQWWQQFGDYYAMAKYFNVLLRIDVLRGAMLNVASSLDVANTARKFRFGFYTFDINAREIFALGDPHDAGTPISQTDVTPIDDNGPYWQTNVVQSIGTFSDTWVDPAGDGSSPGLARKFVFILTDGVEDFAGTGGSYRSTVPFDPTICDRMKNKGVTVLVLHTLNDDPNDQMGENGVLAAVSPLLQKCASGPQGSPHFLSV